METVLYWFVAVIAFGALIAFHEFGHYWVAIRNGMRVERFAIGFGPAIFAKTIGETEWVVGAVPFGGYVKIAGMSPEDEVEDGDDRNYANKAAWRRLLVIGAGPAANYVLAFAIGVPLLLVAHEVADLDVAGVGTVVAGSPAESGGLQPGDKIVKIGASDVTTWKSLTTAVPAEAAKSPGQPVTFVVERTAGRVEVPVTPKKDGDRYSIGITPRTKTLPPLTIAQAVPTAAENLWLGTSMTLTMLWRMVTREAPANLSGPLGILSETAQSAKRGLKDLFQVIWSISLSVGLLNLLPFPGLDGGRLIFLGYEVLARRRVNQRVEAYVHAAGILLLLGLIAIVTFGDLRKMLFG